MCVCVCVSSLCGLLGFGMVKRGLQYSIDLWLDVSRDSVQDEVNVSFDKKYS